MPPVAGPAPFQHSLRLRWIVSILALAVSFSGLGLISAAWMTNANADASARIWLSSASRLSSNWIDQTYATLEAQGAVLSRTPQIITAFQELDVAGLEATLSMALRRSRPSLWIAVSESNTVLATSTPSCSEAVADRLKRASMAVERGTLLLCGDAPAVILAIPIGQRERRGWLVLGELIDAAFVADLGKAVGAEVVLWGPKGQVATTFRDQAGQSLQVGFAAPERTLLEGRPRGYFSDHLLQVSNYRGFTLDNGATFNTGQSSLQCFLYISPLTPSADELPVRMVMALPTEVLTHDLIGNLVSLAVLDLTFVLLLLGISVWVTRKVARGLVELTHAAKRVMAGDAQVQVPEEGLDEVGLVATAFNQMLRTLQEERGRALRTAKMDAVGQLAAGVAHELNNPLGVVLGFAQALERRFPEGDPARFPTESIVRETLRCKELVHSLLTFSRAGTLTLERVDINELVSRLLPSTQDRAKRQGVEVVLQLDAQAPRLFGSSSQLRQAVLSLIVNALDAMPRGGTLTVRTEVLPPCGARITVVDTGAGIPAEIRTRIFEPFFTTKPVGQGPGLGLSFAYEIVSRHHGDIEVESATGRGTIMVISLPGRSNNMSEAAA